jgi:hypothetical protein
MSRFRSARDRGELPDLKREDARACLVAANEFVARGVRLTPARKPPAPSSWVRRRHLLDDKERARGGGEFLAKGLDRALLAAWARQSGLTVTDQEVTAQRKRLRSRSLSEADLRRACEDLALIERLRQNAERVVNDGQGADEALAIQLELEGMTRR